MSTELEWRYEDLRNDLAELQRAMNIEAAQLRQENADLRRQLDVTQRTAEQSLAGADTAIASIEMLRQRALAEAADLRSQLEECQEKASLWDRMRSRMTDEAMDFLMGHMPQDEQYYRP